MVKSIHFPKILHRHSVWTVTEIILTFEPCNERRRHSLIKLWKHVMTGADDSLQALCSGPADLPTHVIIITVFIFWFSGHKSECICQPKFLWQTVAATQGGRDKDVLGIWFCCSHICKLISTQWVMWSILHQLSLLPTQFAGIHFWLGQPESRLGG